MQKRKGASSIKKIDPQILQQLNCGLIETASLVEALAIDFDLLTKSAGIKAPKITAQGIIKKMREASSHIANWEKYSEAKSDTIRGLAAFNLASQQNISFAEKLNSMKKFANDPHFGVREWAWLALRQDVAANLDEAIFLLSYWSCDKKNESIRRFASEITRPRGVWCAHISELKINPQKALKILEPLMCDPSRYVQNSVANWLNDAAKNNEDWVINLTKNWQKKSKSEETSYIIKRALRNVGKQS